MYRADLAPEAERPQKQVSRALGVLTQSHCRAVAATLSHYPLRKRKLVLSVSAKSGILNYY